jgi:carbonic anhydrase/acetyltransferase-like protein (isoleucine patch superfamily)
MGAIILDGCKIGKGSVIAAGSLLPPGFEVPPESLVMGSPAQVKKSVTEADRKLQKGSVEHYMKLAADYMTPSDSTRIRGFLR